MPEIERVTTSIKMNPKIWKKAKIYCIENNIELSKLLEDLLEKKLSESKE